MVISENYCIFIVLNYKEIQIIIAMLTADKVTELFCMADDFCKFFDKMTAKYTLKSENKRPSHRIQLITKLKSNMKGALMSVSDKLLLSKRAIIETVNDELKNIAQVEHSRHR